MESYNFISKQGKEFSIKKATIIDIQGISNLIQENFRSYKTMDWERLEKYLSVNSTQNILKKQFDNPNVTILLAEMEGEIAALLSYEFKVDELYVQKAHSQKKYHNEGLITELFRLALEDCKLREVEIIKVHATKEAVEKVLRIGEKYPLKVENIEHNHKPPLNYSIIYRSIQK